MAEVQFLEFRAGTSAPVRRNVVEMKTISFSPLSGLVEQTFV